MPLQRRIPKFGFKNINRKEYRVINIDTLEDLVKSKKITKEISVEKMIELNLANKNDLIKILGRGKLESSLQVSGHKFSVSARKSIESSGGKVIIVK